MYINAILSPVIKVKLPFKHPFVTPKKLFLLIIGLCVWPSITGTIFIIFWPVITWHNHYSIIYWVPCENKLTGFFEVCLFFQVRKKFQSQFSGAWLTFYTLFFKQELDLDVLNLFHGRTFEWSLLVLVTCLFPKLGLLMHSVWFVKNIP